MPAVDLRSDTLTQPTDEMRRVMAAAPVGDDVYGEDPVVNRLQEAAAERLGKDAGLFVASGTMGNLLGLLAQARSGQEVIADADSHVFLYEAAGAASLGGIQVRQVATTVGVMTAAQVEAAVRPLDDDHQPHTALVTIENTHNRHGGIAWPSVDLAAVAERARAHGLRIHVDGARIFNAAVALDVPARDLVRDADTVTFCLSKGLGAPVGSVLCGDGATIAEARRWRKMVGGGWRQAGMLAAAGLHALDTAVERLAEDHRNARTLAEGLAELPGFEVDLERVQTNIVVFRFPGMAAGAFLDVLSARGIRAGQMGGGLLRFVTHREVRATDVQTVLSVCSEVAGA